MYFGQYLALPRIPGSWICAKIFLVRAPDSINGDGSAGAVAASGAGILASDYF